MIIVFGSCSSTTVVRDAQLASNTAKTRSATVRRSGCIASITDCGLSVVDALSR